MTLSSALDEPNLTVSRASGPAIHKVFLQDEQVMLGTSPA
jgi:hypothetical protein